jgi:hypothetical protein
MGNDKVGVGDPATAVAHDVEVEGARAPVPGADPAPASLDGLAGGEQSSRLEGRLQQDHLVEVGGLVHPGQRLGLLHRGGRDQPGGWQRREGGAGRGEMLLPIAEIAAECDVRPLRNGHPPQVSTAKCRAIRWRSAATSPS